MYKTSRVNTEPQTQPMNYPKTKAKTPIRTDHDAKTKEQAKTDSKTDSKTDPKLYSKVEPKSKTKIDNKAIHQTKITVETPRKPKIKGTTEITVATKTTSESESAIVLKADTNTKSKEETQTESNTKSRTELRTNTKSESYTETTTETETEIKSESLIETEFGANIEPEVWSEPETDISSINIDQQLLELTTEEGDLKIKLTKEQIRQMILARIERLQTAVSADFESLAEELEDPSLSSLSQELAKKLEVSNTYVLHTDIVVDFKLDPVRDIMRQVLRNTLTNVDYETSAPHRKLLAGYMAEVIKLHCCLLDHDRQRLVVTVDIVDKRATGLFSDVMQVWSEDTDRFIKEVFESHTLAAFASLLCLQGVMPADWMKTWNLGRLLPVIQDQWRQKLTWHHLPLSPSYTKRFYPGVLASDNHGWQ